MGFDFSNSVETVAVAISVRQRVDGALQELEVEHVFRAPSAADLDAYRRQLAQVRGRKTRVDHLGAAKMLWHKLIDRVDGYDNLPEEWKAFFLKDQAALLHLQAAVDELLEVAQPSGGTEKN